MTILIAGGMVVNHDHRRRADVLIDGGRIVAVGEKIEAPVGSEIIDAGGAFVMPGGIDPHTHLEMPFMGTVIRRTISRAGTLRAALCRRHDHGRRFLPARIPASRFSMR